jgi:hypothetical protein
VIRGKKVMVSAQADYDQYHQQHAAQYQAYVAGDAKGAELGPDMEVAEGVTKAIGDPELLEAMGLGERPSPEAITALGAGRHGVTGEQLVAPRAGYDRVAYNDLVYSAPKSVSVEFAAARAAGDYVRAAQLVEDIEASVRVGLDTFCQLLPVARRGLHSSLPMHARLAALTNVHSAARPVKGQAVPDPHLHVHTRILNVALGADGKWSAVDYRALYHNVRVLNGLVEAEMQHRLQARGYATVAVTHSEKRENDPLRTERQPWRAFELPRVPEAARIGMSGRNQVVNQLAEDQWRERVATAAKARGRPLTEVERQALRLTPKEVQAVSRASREQKMPRDRAELDAGWGAQLARHGYTAPLASGAVEAPETAQRVADVRSLAVEALGLGGDPKDVADGLRGAGFPHLARGEFDEGEARGVLVAWALSPAGLTVDHSVWTRDEALDRLVPLHAVASSLDPSAIVDVLRRVEAGAVMLDPGAAQGGGDPRSDAVFSTHDLIETERRVATYIAELHDEATINVPEQAIQGALSAEAARGGGHGLDPEQERALRALCSPAGWAGTIGIAGSGKTTTLRPAVDAMQAAGYQVLGVALAGGAAEVLQAETGAPSWNIADFLVRCESGSLWAPDGRPLSLDRKTILLIDEGGTVDSRTFARLIDVAERSGVAALRTVGDPKQTQPVGAGGIFAHLARQLPTAVLSTNYRQGQHQGAAEASASALLRDGQAGKYLMVKDHAGLLQVDDTLDLSAARAVEDWAGAIAAGGSPREHVLLSDLNDVADNLNAQARAAMEQMGRLGPARVQCGQLEYAAGDRVSFVAKHVASRPRVDREGHPLLRKDGTPRTGRVVTPKRTRGEVVGVDPDAGGITVRTDGQGRLPSRLATLTAAEAGNVLGRGYAMTTTTAQARGWDATYGVLCASRVSGLEQAYTMQTRARTETRVYANSESVNAQPDASRDLRTATVDAYAEALGHVTEKCTTLDYATPEARAQLAARMTPHVLRAPRLDGPPTERQRSHIDRLGLVLPDKATWLVASGLIDRAEQKPTGSQATEWLVESYGVERADAERRVARGLRAWGLQPDVGPPAAPTTPMPTPEQRLAGRTTAEQRALADRVGTDVDASRTWLVASSRLDQAMHQPAGTQASAWLVEEHGLDRPEAERIVATALRQRGVNPGVGAPAQTSAGPAPAPTTPQPASVPPSSDSTAAAPDPLAAVRQALKENEQLRRRAVVRREDSDQGTGPSPTPTSTPQPRGPRL